MAVARDRVTWCDDAGRVTVDGNALAETYVYPGDVPSGSRFDVVVPDDRRRVMGDHRSMSADSRAHLCEPGGGMVPEDRVVDRVVAVVRPAARWSGVGRQEQAVETAARRTTP